MPLPSKKENENKEDFVSRCMSNETMRSEYPDEKQRVAICMQQATADCDAVESADFQMQFESFGYEEELNEDNFYIPVSCEYEDFGEDTEEWDIASEKPGLWENIRKKKEREGKNYKPAKPGDPDRPDKEAWKKAQSEEGEGGMTKAQLKKIIMQATQMYMMLKDEEEVEAWVQDNISKSDVHIQSAYDYLMYTDIRETENDEERSEAKFTYKDPRTGEFYYYDRRGPYEREGRKLIYVSRSEVYQGRKVTLNKPFRTPSGPKKFAVYVKNESGNVVIVRFGDPKLSIKKHIPERRKSFRARHGCNNPGPKWKAKYWSCQWSW